MWTIASLILITGFSIWLIWASERYNAKHKKHPPGHHNG